MSVVQLLEAILVDEATVLGRMSDRSRDQRAGVETDEIIDQRLRSFAIAPHQRPILGRAADDGRLPFGNDLGE